MSKRIWELDALRGLCILGMMAVHTLFDLIEFIAVPSLSYPPLFFLFSKWGSVIFLLLSGICASFGGRSLRRGLLLLGCGLGITVVTLFMAAWNFLEQEYIIWFGTLHCLGCCMLLWPLFRSFSVPHLTAAGIAVILTGIRASQLHPSFPWLIPLGFATAGFSSGDYFPLLPCFGFFLLGAVLGRRFYPQRTTLFPAVDPRKGIWRPLCFVGRHSLLFYLAHQPVITGALGISRIIFDF